MKPIIPFALLGALFAVGAAKAAVTDPVGYITHTVFTQAGAETLTIVSPSLVRPDVFAGRSTVSPSGGSVITLPPGVPAGLGIGHVLEISASGWWATVLSSDATLNQITVNSPFPAGLPANTPVTVRLHTTVRSFLGANAPGLTAVGGAGTPDEVQILNSSEPGQPLTTIIYVPAAISTLPQDGWFYASNSQPADDQVIEPGSAVLIKCFQNTNLTFTSSGDVKQTPTEYDVYPGLNLVGTHSAVGNTLNGMGFNTSLVQITGSNGDFDEFQTLSPVQALVSYVAAVANLLTPPNPLPTMALLSDSTDAGTVSFPEGTGGIIKRDPGKPLSTITLPASVVAP